MAKWLWMIERMTPDVAVLDIQMPKATGIEVSREIRATSLANWSTHSYVL